jgi:hypothetical protein
VRIRPSIARHLRGMGTIVALTAWFAFVVYFFSGLARLP